MNADMIGARKNMTSENNMQGHSAPHSLHRLQGMHAPQLRHLQPLYRRYAAQPRVLHQLQHGFALRRADPAETTTLSPELALQLSEFLYGYGDPHAMAWVANELDMGAGEGLVYFLRSAQTVGQAWRELVRLAPMLFPDGSVELIHTASDWQIRIYPLIHPERLGMQLRYEAICCWLVRVMRFLLGTECRPLHARLITPDSGRRDLTAYLGDNLTWSAAAFELSWPSSLWHAQLPSASASLFTSLQSHFSLSLNEIEARDTLARQTCRFLLQEQALARAEISDVARALSLSIAQYQRKLAQESTSFRQILLALKRAQSVQRLGGGALRLEALAQALGFAERSAFERAFRGWFACTPSQFRRELTQLRTALKSPQWDAPSRWPFPCLGAEQMAAQLALESPDCTQLARLWQLNPKHCALLMAELNQPECGALVIEQIDEALSMLSTDAIKSIGYAAIGHISIGLQKDTADFWYLSYFLQQVCRSTLSHSPVASSMQWAAFFCLLAGDLPRASLATLSQRAAVLLACWGVPQAIVRQLFLWGAQSGKAPHDADYEYLNAALTWARQPSSAPADPRWAQCWQDARRLGFGQVKLAAADLPNFTPYPYLPVGIDG